MKILITGGAGFIGSNFIRYIIKKYRSYQIINLDKLTYAGCRNNLKKVARHKNYEFVKADICHDGVVEKLTARCDAIVHFAAETHVDRSIKDGSEFVRTNVLGTHTLLQAALKARVKRFVHISTDEVYGSRITGAFKEDDPLNPSSPYSASKAGSDLLALSFFVTHHLPVMVTRSSNNFGPYQYPEKVIPLFVTNLIQNKKVPLYAKGENIRDWIFVEDHCRGIDLVLHKGSPGEIYNIGGDNYLTNLALTRTILNRMGKTEAMIQRVKDRPGHDFRYAIDCAKIKRLGFLTQQPFEEALALTIDWYKKNASWWQKLKG